MSLRPEQTLAAPHAPAAPARASSRLNEVLRVGQLAAQAQAETGVGMPARAAVAGGARQLNSGRGSRVPPHEYKEPYVAFAPRTTRDQVPSYTYGNPADSVFVGFAGYFNGKYDVHYHGNGFVRDSHGHMYVPYHWDRFIQVHMQHRPIFGARVPKEPAMLEIKEPFTDVPDFLRTLAKAMIKKVDSEMGGKWPTYIRVCNVNGQYTDKVEQMVLFDGKTKKVVMRVDIGSKSAVMKLAA